MRLLTHLVVEKNIGPELSATLGDSPRLGGCYQRGSYTAAPSIRIDVPALEIGDAPRLAPVHDVSDGELRESDRPALVVERQKDFGLDARVAAEEPLGFCEVHRLVARPECAAHPDPVWQISWPGRPDERKLHWEHQTANAVPDYRGVIRAASMRQSWPILWSATQTEPMPQRIASAPPPPAN